MNSKLLFQNKAVFVLVVTVLAAVHLTWDYFHGGVPTHYILHSKDLPGISNWWELLTVPLMSWVLLSFMNRSILKGDDPGAGFFLALLYGITMAVLWHVGLADVMQYLIWLPVAMSLFVRVHGANTFLGFFLGMVFTFGGVLPIGIGLILFMISFLVYKLVRGVLLLIRGKLAGQA